MDYNSLNNNSFTFILNRIPKIAFRIVSINLPDISISPPTGPNPMGVQYFPGSAPDFGSLRMTFVVDENLLNYEELYRWINQQIFSKVYAPKTTEERFLVSDGTLVSLTNASNPNRTIIFKDMFPISLGSIEFDTRDSSVSPVMCTAEFKFSYFILEPKIYPTSSGFMR